MNTHLTELEVEDYVHTRLRAGDLRRIEAHLDQCEACRDAIRAAYDARQSEGEAVEEVAIIREAECPDFYAGYSYYGGNLNEEQHHLFEDHLHECPSCAEVWAEYQEQLESEQESTEKRPSLGILVLAAVGVGVGLFGGLAWQRSQVKLHDIEAYTLQITQSLEKEQQDKKRLSASLQKLQTDQRAVVAQNRQLDVKLKAATAQNATLMARVNSVARPQSSTPFFDLKPPTVADEIPALTEPNAKYAGEDNTTHPLLVTPLMPVATAVRERHPLFRWKPVSGVAQYTLSIYTDKGVRVITETTKATFWMPSVSLARGVRYEWRIDARDAQGSTIANAPHQQRIYFYLLSEAQERTLVGNERRFAQDPLLWGIELWHYGVWDAAEKALNQPMPTQRRANAQNLLQALRKQRPRYEDKSIP